MDTWMWIMELSLAKLYQPQASCDEEVTLRKKVLIRNLMNSYSMMEVEHEKQQEQVWLDACFNQLDVIVDDHGGNDTPQHAATTTATTIPPSTAHSPHGYHPHSFPHHSHHHQQQQQPLPGLQHASPSSTTTIVLAVPSTPTNEKLLALMDWSWSEYTSLP